MHIILDTNILLSALLTRGTSPDALFQAWYRGRFQLISCEQQLEEINRVSRRPFFKSRLTASEIGRMVNDIRHLSLIYHTLPVVTRSPDPDDDFLLALAETAKADFLVTGDKCDLLALKRHQGTKIVTACYLAQQLNINP